MLGAERIYDTMPRRKTGVTVTPQKDTPKQDGKKGNKRFSVEFVNISLNVDDKAALAESTLTSEELALSVFRLVDNGFKVSLGFNARTDSFIASITGQIPDTPNYKRCVTSHGSSAENALLALQYKYEVYCPDGEFPSDDGNSFYGDFG